MGPGTSAEIVGAASPSSGGLAAALIQAHATGRPIPPISQTVPGLTLDDAYAIQQELVGSWVADGRRVIGRKVGLTSAAMQRMLGVDQPDFGVITDDMIIPNRGRVSRHRFIAPRIEPEVAFIMERDLAGADTTSTDVLAAVRFVAPALEVIDSRIADWKIGIVDTVADNASSAAVVIGEPVETGQVDLRGMGCILRRDGAIQATGAGGAVLGSPLVAIAWLVRTLDRFGEGLLAGDIVIPGSVTPAHVVDAAATWTAEFAGAGRVTVSFTEEDE